MPMQFWNKAQKMLLSENGFTPSKKAVDRQKQIHTKSRTRQGKGQMKAARTDANHSDIRDGLRQIPGVSVADTSAVGKGFPDLVVAYKAKDSAYRHTVLLEVKDGNKPPSKRKLTKAQKQFHAEWSGYVHVVTNLDEALRVVGVL